MEIRKRKILNDRLLARLLRRSQLFGGCEGKETEYFTDTVVGGGRTIRKAVDERVWNIFCNGLSIGFGFPKQKLSGRGRCGVGFLRENFNLRLYVDTVDRW